MCSRKCKSGEDFQVSLQVNTKLTEVSLKLVFTVLFMFDCFLESPNVCVVGNMALITLSVGH